MNTYESIVWDLASACSARICRRVVRQLQQHRELQSGDDSPLVSAWEEICVQVQDERSVLWSVYDDLARGYIERGVRELAKYEFRALWLETPEGIDWVCKEDGEQGPPPSVMDDVVEYLADDLYSRAADWSNDRIRRYLDRGE